ncbi:MULTISPECIES: hypothetical protein [unclassified Mesorhizobium]|uniref:hypothetical protein n=1 Tax=unclassified Mesorhizobium TaxID=325217 RepID=UPI00167B6D44|nr:MULTISPECIES: hypothetical protein [unclassified Mesorhizobium]
MAAHLKSRAGNGRPTRIGEAILAGLSRDGTLTVAANVPHVIGRKDDMPCRSMATIAASRPCWSGCGRTCRLTTRA